MSVFVNIYDSQEIAHEYQDLINQAADLAVYSVPNFAKYLIDNEFNCQFDLSFVSSEQIKQLNSDYRGINQATDVLSFPLLDISKGKLIQGQAGMFLNPDAEYPTLLLGDLIISPEIAIRQAEEYGHGLDRELIFLMVHGILHLLGFDHVEPDEECEMIKLQDFIMNRLGLSRGETNE